MVQAIRLVKVYCFDSPSATKFALGTAGSLFFGVCEALVVNEKSYATVIALGK